MSEEHSYDAFTFIIPLLLFKYILVKLFRWHFMLIRIFHYELTEYINLHARTHTHKTKLVEILITIFFFFDIVENLSKEEPFGEIFITIVKLPIVPVKVLGLC